MLALHRDMLNPAQQNRHTHNKAKKAVTVLAISDPGQAPACPGEEVQGREGMTYSQPFLTKVRATVSLALLGDSSLMSPTPRA